MSLWYELLLSEYRSIVSGDHKSKYLIGDDNLTSTAAFAASVMALSLRFTLSSTNIRTDSCSCDTREKTMAIPRLSSP